MNIKKSTIITIFLFYLVLILLWGIGNFTNTDFVALVVYIFFLLEVYHIDKKILVKYMFMFVMFSYHLLSVFISDNFNITFYNLMKSSYKTGCFIPLLLYYMIYFAVVIILESSDKKTMYNKDKFRSKKYFFGSFTISEKKLVRFVSGILIVFTAVMVVRMGKNSFYSLGGIDRFEYRSTYFSELDEKFYTYILWLLPIPLMGNNLKMKKSANLFFVFYCLYMISVGDKFGSLFIAFYFYMLVSWATQEMDKKLIKKMGVIVVVMLIALLAFVTFQVLYDKGTWDEVLIYFKNRLTGGQSDLWWGIFSIEKGGSWRLTEFFKDEVCAIFNKPSDVIDYNFGIYKMMRVTAPSSVVNSYLSRGVRFAASTQASLFYYFKYTGLIIGSILMGKVSFVLVNNAVKAYQKFDILRAILYTMFISKFIQIMTMSDITMLGNSTTILGVIALITLKILESQKSLSTG